jgi:hypothetical protein
VLVGTDFATGGGGGGDTQFKHTLRRLWPEILRLGVDNDADVRAGAAVEDWCPAAT